MAEKPSLNQDDHLESDPRESALRDQGKQFSRTDLRGIAISQKGILVCILLYLTLGAVQFVFPPEVRVFLLLPAAFIILTATVFVFLLATKVYGTGLGILFGVLTMIPLVGLFVLLIINGKATSVLKSHGIPVGLMGANLSDVD